jgi:hypothetical protein
MSIHKTESPPLALARSPWRRRFLWLLAIVIVLPLAIAAYFAGRFSVDEPVDYANPEDHFKYGSTGGEREVGFPYWIWQALPQVCGEFLPGKGYASLGMVYEDGKDLPVGVSKRRNLGLDRVFLNCAACHASTVRDTPASAPRIYAGMPAQTFDIMAFEKFFFECGASAKFSAENVIPEIERQAGKLSILDKRLVYPLAIYIMRDRLLTLRGRFEWVYKEPHWGPGRVDTFNSAKVQYNFPMAKLDPKELAAPGDFPAIWNQRQKKGMQLHWDGNNGKVEERNKNAAFGTGTTPPTIDMHRVERVEQWLLDAKPPAYPYPIDSARSGKGATIYQEYCAGCHGANGQNFALPEAREVDCIAPGAKDDDIVGATVGKVTPWEAIGTDRRRLDSFTYDLVLNLSTLYAGYPHRFCHFRKSFGYANMPLDGLWLRAPYLHNGSVPTLRDLLEPSASRPKEFYRGNDVFDPVRVGFVSNVAEANGRKLFKLDTATLGNGNQGHEGKRYGTELSAEDKDALVEYLKTF